MSEVAPASAYRLKPAGQMLGATVLTGVLGWVCIAVAGHRVGPDGYARFSVVWGVLFGLVGAFSGLQQEVTRSTHRARAGDEPVWRRAAGVAVSLCVVAGLVVLLVRPADVGRTPMQLLLVIAALAGFAGLTFVNGVLSQREQWRWVAAVLALDARVRTAAVLLVLEPPSHRGRHACGDHRRRALRLVGPPWVGGGPECRSERRAPTLRPSRGGLGARSCPLGVRPRWSPASRSCWPWSTRARWTPRPAPWSPGWCWCAARSCWWSSVSARSCRAPSSAPPGLSVTCSG